MLASCRRAGRRRTAARLVILQGARCKGSSRTCIYGRGEGCRTILASKARWLQLSDPTAVYLIFNEGYTAARGEDWMRPQRCGERVPILD